MKFAGLDEAALGPFLGPFCACLIQISSPKSLDQNTDLYDVLQDVVSFNGLNPALTAVGDSKILYKPSRGIGLLEEAIMVFLEVTGVGMLRSLKSWVGAFCPDEDLQALKHSPWFACAELENAPLSSHSCKEIQKKAKALSRQMDAFGMVLLPPELRFVTASSFNQAIISYKGKSSAIRSILRPLMRTAFLEKGLRQCRITVDRQGGRRYYGDWLANVFPGLSLRTEAETPRQSVYWMNEKRIDFLVSADKIRLETALASMFSKYLRELGMKYFNQWWGSRIDGLRPTAGYPRDSRRFIADIKAANALPTSLNDLVRIL